MLGTMYVVCVCYQQWSVEQSHTRRPGSGQPRNTDARQDRRIVRAAVALPGKKSGHMLHLLCHQDPLGTVCLQQDSDYVCVWPGYHLHHDTANHGYSGIVKESTGEWNGALLSSAMRVGSVCILVMDVHVYGVDLVSVIFRSALVQDTGPTSGFVVFGAISYNLRSDLVFLQGKVNCTRYIALVVVNPVVPSFI